MRILLFGITHLCLDLLKLIIKEDYNLIGLVFDNSNNQDIRAMKSLAKSRYIPCFELNNLNDTEFLNTVEKTLVPDVILVLTFNQKLPVKLYSLAKIAAINMHPSYLPDYKGASPYFWPIANGEKTTGVTFHHLNADYDSGDIIVQEKVAINIEDTNGMVVKKQLKVAWPMLKNILNNIEATKQSPSGLKQMLGNYKKAPRPTSDDFYVKWNWPSQKILDRIRALNPFSAAYAIFRDEVIGIYQAKITSFPSNKNVGTIIAVTAEGPIIKTGDGAVLLMIVVVGKKYLLTGADFIANESIKVDEVLG